MIRSVESSHRFDTAIMKPTRINKISNCPHYAFSFVCLHRFDMRLYCLVTSFSPLKVYLYRGGFARFANSRYSSGQISEETLHDNEITA